MTSKQRLLELNSQLAEILTNKGIVSEGSETTTNLINKVSKIAATEDFVGVKYFDFDSNNLPKTADVRSFSTIINSNNQHIFTGLFRNDTASNNGGPNEILEKVYLPDGITNLHSTFYNCSKLTTLEANLETVINLNRTFYNCKSLSKVPYMPNLEIVDKYSFYGCINLLQLNIYKKLTTFAEDALSNCTNLTDIYVPWSEGEVTGAPWGASNAIVHYNTQFDEKHNPIIAE